MDRRLSHLSTLANLLEADSASVAIDNQKNGQRDATLHHDALPANPLCLVRASAHWFVWRQRCNPANSNAIISLNAPNKHLSVQHMAGHPTRCCLINDLVQWL